MARIGDRRGAYRILVGRPDGKRPLGRSRRRWEGYLVFGFLIEPRIHYITV